MRVGLVSILVRVKVPPPPFRIKKELIKNLHWIYKKLFCKGTKSHIDILLLLYNDNLNSVLF